MLDRQPHSVHGIPSTISENSTNQDTKKDTVQKDQKKYVKMEAKFLFPNLTSAMVRW